MAQFDAKAFLEKYAENTILQLSEKLVNPSWEPTGTQTLVTRDKSSGAQELYEVPVDYDPEGYLRLAQLLSVVDSMHRGLADGSTTTMRSVYYDNKELFLFNQAISDKIIDSICVQANHPRHVFNVEASSNAKVLMSRSVTFRRGDRRFQAATDMINTVPSELQYDVIVVERSVKWVVVVEKESIFAKIATPDFCEDEKLGKGIIVTSHGVPDYRTARFLQSLDKAAPWLKFGIITDCDPAGLMIAATLMFGSQSSHFSPDMIDQPLKKMRWLGLSIQQCHSLGIYQEMDKMVKGTPSLKMARNMSGNEDLSSAMRDQARQLAAAKKTAGLEKLSRSALLTRDSETGAVLNPLKTYARRTISGMSKR